MRFLSWRARKRQAFVFNRRRGNGSAPRRNVQRKTGGRIQPVSRAAGSRRLRTAEGIWSAQYGEILGRDFERRLGALTVFAQRLGPHNAGIADCAGAAREKFS